MVWWLWAVGGLVLFIGEILTPGGFYIFFFGMGAILTGLLQLLGMNLPFWLQLLVFTISSVIFLLLFRKPMLRRMQKGGPDHEVDQLVGEEIDATSSIAPDSNGPIEFRGTVWTAKNIGAAAIETGDRCIIRKVAGLKLEIEKTS